MSNIYVWGMGTLNCVYYLYFFLAL